MKTRPKFWLIASSRSSRERRRLVLVLEVRPSPPWHRFPLRKTVWFFAGEIQALISSWPSSSSLTPHGIPLKFIKGVIEYIAGPLEYLFNLSFMRSEVPMRWRKAVVIPIPRKPPYSNPDNFRPISITSVFARTFEKILKKRIVTIYWSIQLFLVSNMVSKRGNPRLQLCCTRWTIGRSLWMKVELWMLSTLPC